MNFSFSKDQLSTLEKVKEFCSGEIAPKAAELDEAAPEASVAMIRERITALADAGLLGLGFPKEVEGSGADLFGPIFLLQELGATCASTALAVLSTGLCARALYEWGTPAMREKDLPDLLAGRTVGAFGDLEPEEGLDAWSVQTTASAAGDDFTLTGRKLMVLNAPVGGVRIFPASQGDEPGLFRVAPDAAGVEISPAQVKMGCRGVPTGDVTLTDCPATRLPAENGAAALAWLRSHEHLMFAAMAEGMIHGALVASGVYARDHKAGGKPLGRHQEISFKLADGKVLLETTRVLIYRSVWLMEQKDEQAPVLASGAKAFAAEAAVKVAGNAVQIFGQEGFLTGSRAERFYRDVKLLEILGNPTEKHRMFIADRVLEA
jgi:butyryl-CoA dehydrogenase